MCIAEFTPSVFQAISSVVSGGTSGAIVGAANQLLVGLCNVGTGASITGVGSGFAQAPGSYESKVSLEYQSLSGSGNVGSNFILSGSSSAAATLAFTLSSTPTPAANASSLLQSPRTNSYSSHVAQGNTLVAIGYGAAAPQTPTGCSDTLGNVWTLVTSACQWNAAPSTPSRK